MTNPKHLPVIYAVIDNTKPGGLQYAGTDKTRAMHEQRHLVDRLVEYRNVVLCKDCKLWTTDDDEGEMETICGISGNTMDGSDFCSKGEAKS